MFDQQEAHKDEQRSACPFQNAQKSRINGRDRRDAKDRRQGPDDVTDDDTDGQRNDSPEPAGKPTRNDRNPNRAGCHEQDEQRTCIKRNLGKRKRHSGLVF